MRYKIAATLCALVAIAICVCVLVLWILYPNPPGTEVAFWRATKPVTLLCLCGLSIAVLLMLRSDTGPAARTGRLLGIVFGLTGAAALLEYAFGREPGESFAAAITTALFPALQLADPRISPLAAVCIVLHGASIILLGTRPASKHCPGQWVCLAPFTIAVVVLIGHGYGVQRFYQIGTYSPMAMPTAVCIALIAFGTVFCRPAHEPVRIFSSATLGGFMARRIVPAAFMFPICAGWLRLQGERLGWYGMELGVAYLAMANILFFSLLTSAISRKLASIDEERAKAAALLAAAQRELARHASALEDQVQDRTAELRETIHELERFSYSMSHDMRAPLRAMRGFADLLKEESSQQLGPQGAFYLERISSAATRLDQLIRDVLTYSKIVQEQIVLTPVDVERLVHQLIDESPTLQPPQAEISIDSPLLPVMGHEAYLTQAISNLLYNAVKFVRPGNIPRIRIWTERDGDTVRLSVRDNGIGIPKQTQHRLFGIFERLNTEYEGTGIGLSIVRKAAERMGGTVGVESQEGVGSTFWIRLNAG